MWLPSRLERSTLGDLLGSLHRGGVTGRLELVEVDGAAAGARRTIHLLSGEVVRVEGSGRRLGERLATSVAGQVAIERALAARADDDTRLAGEVLLTRGLSDTDAIRAALEAQARERLEGLFALRRAQIRFRVASGPAPSAPRISLGPDAFLHGRPRLTPRVAPPTPAAPDALALLGLAAHDAPSVDTIRRAFRRRAAALHPDRARDVTSRRVLERAFAQLGDAYRRALDAKLSAA